MRKFAYFAAAIVSVTGICLGLVADDAPSVKKNAPPAASKAPAKSTAEESKTGAKESPVKTANGTNKEPSAKEQAPVNQEPDVPAKYAADETAIRQAHESLLKAYASDKAEVVVEHFTQDGEYVNSSGAVFHGRAAIQSSLTDFLADHPGCELDAELHDVRFVSPTVAVVEGTTTVAHNSEGEVAEINQCHFTAIYNKLEEKWLLASIRDRQLPSRASHEDEIAQLSFLIGDWIDEDADSTVYFSCRPADNGKFLIREFAMKVEGREVLTGTERIGWDPLTGKLRAWVFDSEGGFAEGTWQMDGDAWVLRLAGVTADGEPASGTYVYRIVSTHSMTWQGVEHVVGGVTMPDSPEFTLVHKSPHPADQDEKPADLDLKRSEESETPAKQDKKPAVESKKSANDKKPAEENE